MQETLREAGSIPGLGRSPGGGHGNPFQYPCLENSMDRGAWWVTVRRVAKSWIWLKRLSTHTRHPEKASFNNWQWGGQDKTPAPSPQSGMTGGPFQLQNCLWKSSEASGASALQFSFSSAHFCFLYPLLRVDPGGTPIYFLCVNFCFIFPENPILDKKMRRKKMWKAGIVEERGWTFWRYGSPSGTPMKFVSAQKLQMFQPSFQCGRLCRGGERPAKWHKRAALL